MKSNALKLLLLIFLILVTIFFERLVPDYPQWKYITFVPVVMLSSNLVYRKKNKANIKKDSNAVTNNNPVDPWKSLTVDNWSVGVSLTFN